MASNPAAQQAPRSFRQDAGLEHLDSKLTFQEAVIAVEALKMQGPLASPVITNRPVGELDVADLPLRLLNVEGGTKLIQFSDVIPDVEGPLDFDAIAGLMVTGKYQDLPGMLALKTQPSVPYTMQLVCIPQERGQVPRVEARELWVGEG